MAGLNLMYLPTIQTISSQITWLELPSDHFRGAPSLSLPGQLLQGYSDFGIGLLSCFQEEKVGEEVELRVFSNNSLSGWHQWLYSVWDKSNKSAGPIDSISDSDVQSPNPILM